MSVSATQVRYELSQSPNSESEPQSDVTTVCTPLALIIVTVRYSFADSKSPLTATPRLKPKTVGAGVGADVGDVGPKVGAGVDELPEIWTDNTQKNPLIRRVSSLARKLLNSRISVPFPYGGRITLLTHAGGCPAWGGGGVE